MFAERIPKTCSFDGFPDVSFPVADAVNVEDGFRFCVSKSVGEKIRGVKVSHENSVVDAGEESAAVAARDGDGVCDTVCIRVLVQVCARFGIDLHCVDVGTGEGSGESEVADAGEHVGNPFTGTNEAADSLFFEPVALREHDFCGVEGVDDAGFAERDVVGNAVQNGDGWKPHDTGVLIELKDAGRVFPGDEGLEVVRGRDCTMKEEGVAEPLVAGSVIGFAFGKIECRRESVTDGDVGVFTVAVWSPGLVNPGFSPAFL